ncbi:MAG: glycosyl hydrolase, partial [Winogradskyella sp.]|nr:glycosyl hydrolase [Winogradskyella sp.]
DYFKDERYIKVNGKPMFMVYRPKLFPDIIKTIALWREEVKKAGFPDLYMGFAKNSEYKTDFKNVGFDFAFEFQPNFSLRPKALSAGVVIKKLKNLARKFGLRSSSNLEAVYDYEAYAKLQIDNGFVKDCYPTITPMWDNSSRRKVNYFILHDSSPDKYKLWLTHIKDNYPWRDMPESFLFINAWNEWAEGNHLEPCQKWGTAYLDATKEVLGSD